MIVKISFDSKNENKYSLFFPMKNKRFNIVKNESNIDIQSLVKSLEIDDKDNNTIDESLALNITNWINNGWFISLMYHFASIHSFYVDYDDTTFKKKKQYIEDYMLNKDSSEVVEFNSNFRINLSDVEFNDSMYFKNIYITMLKRRTIRKFRLHSVNIAEIQIAIKKGMQRIFTTYLNKTLTNSKLKPLISYGQNFDYYISFFNVTGCESGLYKVDVVNKSLILLKKGNFSNQIFEYTSRQSNVFNAVCTFFFTLDFERVQRIYKHDKALRNMFIESGRIAQELILSFENVNLKCLPTPALEDGNICEFLEIDKSTNYPMYSLTFGQ